MDLSKIYSKTSELASNAAKTSMKIINQAKDFIDDTAQPQMPGSNPNAGPNQLGGGSSVELPPNMRINGMDISFVRLLDEGGFSYVFEAIDLRTGAPLAVKRLLIQDHDSATSVKKEIKIMQDLKDHPHIINIFGILELMEGNKRVIYIVMEKAKMSLVQVMQGRLDRGKRFTESELLSIFHSVCSGVEALHRADPPVQHRDLKVENVLRAGDTFKLCDFGSATTRVYSLDSKQERSQAEEDISKNTTLAYRSPEMCDLYSEFPINEKSDIWALGCILYKLCYFIGPFDEAAAEGSYLPIINCKYALPKEPKISEEILDFIKEMLEVNVEKRPDIWEVLERVCELRKVQNTVERPSHKPQVQKSKDRNLKSSKVVKPKKKQEDLFDLLGGDESQSTSTSKKDLNNPKLTVVQSSSQSTFGFDDNDDWDAGFDNDPFADVNRSQSKTNSRSTTHQSTPVSLTPTSATPSKNANIFDDLDWSAPSPTISTHSAHSTESSSTRPTLGSYSNSTNNLDFDFSSLTLNTTPQPKNSENARQKILQTMDHSQQGMPQGGAQPYDSSSLNRSYNSSMSSVYGYPTPPSSPYPTSPYPSSPYPSSPYPQNFQSLSMYPAPGYMQPMPAYPQYNNANHYSAPSSPMPPSPAHTRSTSHSSQGVSPYPTTPSTNPFDEFF